MTAPNADQIAAWNDSVGRRWVEAQERLDVLLAPLGEVGLTAAAVRPGERALDVGCGCGATSLSLADMVGASGSVVGVDVSTGMLARAQERGAGRSNLSFLEADAAVGALPGPFDLVFSRFGVMFFDDPAAAFRHLRAALRPGGRMVFVCWRAFPENAWAFQPVMAVIKALGIAPQPPQPNAPGPFAFADEARVRTILDEAGFTDIQIRAHDAALRMGASPADAAQASLEVGPLARLLDDVDADARGRARAAVEAVLEEHATPEGVSLGGAVWVVSASA